MKQQFFFSKFFIRRDFNWKRIFQNRRVWKMTESNLRWKMSTEIISREIIRQFVYYQLNSRTYSLNDLGLSFIWENDENINYLCIRLQIGTKMTECLYGIYRRSVFGVAKPRYENFSRMQDTSVYTNCGQLCSQSTKAVLVTHSFDQVDGKLCFSPFVSHLFPNAVIYHVESSKCKYR